MTTATALIRTNGSTRHALTTGQVASLCGTSSRTVTKWTDTGLLPHFRLPGTTDRRIYPEDLEAFCLSQGMARTVAAIRGVRGVYVLAVGLPATVTDALALHLPDGWQLAATASVWDTATAVHRCRPVGVLLDAGIGRCNAREIAEALAREHPRPRVVVVVSDDYEPGTYLPAGLAVEVATCTPAAELAQLLTG